MTPEDFNRYLLGLLKTMDMTFRVSWNTRDWCLVSPQLIDSITLISKLCVDYENMFKKCISALLLADSIIREIHTCTKEDLTTQHLLKRFKICYKFIFTKYLTWLIVKLGPTCYPAIPLEADNTKKLNMKLFGVPLCRIGFCSLLGINQKRVLGPIFSNAVLVTMERNTNGRVFL